jgi:isopentenyl phosphate kinase
MADFSTTFPSQGDNGSINMILKKIPTIPQLLLFSCFCFLHLSFPVLGDVAQTSASKSSQSENFTSFKDLDIILVKIGGSSITYKSEFERVNKEAVEWFARTIAQSTSEIFLNGEEQSRQCPGPRDDAHSAKKFGFVIVHGAGSFGHFQAKEYGLKGQSTPPPVLPSTPIKQDLHRQRRRRKEGLAKTRLSVQKLNQIVVKDLVHHGVNAVAISPCFGIPGLQTHANLQFDAQAHLHSLVYETIQAGLIPVLHGDACLYGMNGAGILSGDTLMEILGVQPWVRHAVFITDVDGVFDKDPRSDATAKLLSYIAVDASNGEIIAEVAASGSSHEHDVTGGLKVSRVIDRKCCW